MRNRWNISVARLCGVALVAAQALSVSAGNREFLTQNVADAVHVRGYLTCGPADAVLATFCVTNVTDRAVLLRSDYLPWAGKNTLVLAFADVDTNSVIIPPLAISDLLSQDISIPPGESIQGVISLSERLPQMSRFLNSRDGVLFWAFRLRQSGSNKSQLLSGTVLLSKADLCRDGR